VTSFLYRAHPVSTVLGGVIAYARDQAAAILRYYRDFMPAAPDELTAYAGLISMSDGTPAVGVIACYCGDLAGASAFSSCCVPSVRRCSMRFSRCRSDDAEAC
jgi:hypothetical protein